MSEFITLQVGQCGNQIGGVFWPLVLKEYGILDVRSNKPKKIQKIYEESYHCFFHDSRSSPSEEQWDFKNMRARALLIDMEENVVQRFRKGILRDIFDKSCSLTNHPGSGNNWAVGYYTHGLEQKSKLEDMIRTSAEKCDSLHGFISLFSLGGGTGSGLGTFSLSLLENDYPKTDRIVCCVLPGGNNDVITSPYNISLSLGKLIQNATCVIPVDNEALLEISTRTRMSKKLQEMPYGKMNGIIVKMLLNLTCGARFPGTLNMDMNELSVNMVPSPGLHFLASSVGPLANKTQQSNSYSRDNNIFNEVYSPQNHLLRIDILKGLLFGATLLVRGDTSVSTLRKNVTHINRKFNFTLWSKNAVKVGHCNVSPWEFHETVLLLTNPSVMGELFSEALKDFEKLYSRKAHIHHYLKVDGFEAEEFSQTKEALYEIIRKYHICCNEIKIPRFKVL